MGVNSAGGRSVRCRQIAAVSWCRCQCRQHGPRLKVHHTACDPRMHSPRPNMHPSSCSPHNPTPCAVEIKSPVDRSVLSSLLLRHEDTLYRPAHRPPQRPRSHGVGQVPQGLCQRIQRLRPCARVAVHTAFLLTLRYECALVVQIWGAGTASYQIEGAVKQDGREESIWVRPSQLSSHPLSTRSPSFTNPPSSPYRVLHLPRTASPTLLTRRPAVTRAMWPTTPTTSGLWSVRIRSHTAPSLSTSPLC